MAIWHGNRSNCNILLKKKNKHYCQLIFISIMHSLISFRTPPPSAYQTTNHVQFIVKCCTYRLGAHGPCPWCSGCWYMCVCERVRDAHSVPITGDLSCYAQSKSSSPCHVVFHSCNRVNLVHHLPSSLSLIFLNWGCSSRTTLPLSLV